MSKLSDGENKAVVVDRLREMIAAARGVHRGSRVGCSQSGDGRRVVPSGLAALDAALAGGGFEAGWLVDCQYDAVGAGALQVGLRIALAVAGGDEASSAAGHGHVVMVDGAGDLYPPGLRRMGFCLERVLIVKPADAREACWAIDQCLRCPQVAAVVATVKRVDGIQWRRWQLAAEESGAVGIIVGPVRGGARRSFAAVQMRVESARGDVRCGGVRRVRVRLTRVRGGNPGGLIEVELADEAHLMPLFSVSGDRPGAIGHRA